MERDLIMKTDLEGQWPAENARSLMQEALEERFSEEDYLEETLAHLRECIAWNSNCGHSELDFMTNYSVNDVRNREYLLGELKRAGYDAEFLSFERSGTHGLMLHVSWK